MLSADDLAVSLSDEMGFLFAATAGEDEDGRRWILLSPSGLSSKHTFGIRLTIGWRRFEIRFEPGAFAGSLLSEMGGAGKDSRVVFVSILSACQREGAQLHLRINGHDRDFADLAIWSSPWSRFDLVLRKGNIEIGDLDVGSDIEFVRGWVLRFAGAISAILPLDESSEDPAPDNQKGFPEGAITTILVNRYERDRRNRAAAIALHGLNCKGCGMSFAERYGEIALGFIEIHHLVPVSKMGIGYVVDPVTDLVPLCSNCHSVIHRQDPPMTIEELRRIIQLAS